jgi:excinuclease ABC subunit B
MQRAAGELDFETAAGLRDRLALLRDMELGLKLPARDLLEAVQPRQPAGRRRGGGRYWQRVRY